MKAPGWIIVPSPISAESEICLFDGWNGKKYWPIFTKSRNGSSEISRAFPSGQSTSLLIKTIVALDCNALS